MSSARINQGSVDRCGERSIALQYQIHMQTRQTVAESLSGPLIEA